jgi:uncharacterized protein YuzE
VPSHDKPIRLSACASNYIERRGFTAKELGDGIVAEYDAQDRLVGLEILDAGSRLDGQSTFREVILEGIGLTAPSEPSRAG